jgi:hypothetical protein
MPSKSTLWRICCAIIIVLSVLAFSPLVLTQGEHLPELFGMPRTLWLGILIAFLMVGLTFIGGRIHPANDGESRNNQPGDQSADQSGDQL